MDERSLRVLEFDKILGLLAEEAASSLGRARALALQPASDPAVVRRRLAETSEAVALLERFGPMPLGGLRDLHDSLRRAEAEVTLTGSEFLAIADLIECSERVREYARAGAKLAPTIAARAAQLSDQQLLRDEITRLLDEEGNVRRNASEELQRLYQRLATLEGRLRERLESLRRQAAAQDLLQEPIIVQRGGRYCLPVRSERQGQLRGLIHDRSASGATVFMEPLEIVPLGNELRETELRIRDEIKRLLRELTLQVGAAAPVLRDDLEILAELDFWHACARLARRLNATAPLVREDGVIILKAARHPLLPGPVVPIDFWLGERFHTLLITGPNTGGKTVSLKTVGLLTLMAQAGLHIPAAPGSQINVFESIWADIGDEQSIEQSLSTFSSHMTQIIKIIHRVDAWRRRQERSAARSQATRGQERPPPGGEGEEKAAPRLWMNSLVLLDELGAGTDPTEGAALGQAILEELHAAGCRTVATTHYNDLKLFAYATEGMENASVEFDVKTLQPTYRLSIGEPGSSNALQIAQRLGLPRRLVARARQFLGGEHLHVEDALREMRRSRDDLERERRAAAAAERELARLREEYAQKLQALEAERTAALQEGYARALKIVHEAEEEARRIIADLQRQPRQSKITEGRRQEIAALRERLEREAAADAGASASPTNIVPPDAEKAPASPPAFMLGQPVHVKALHRLGRIAERLSEERYLVEIGPLKIEAVAEDLEPAEPPVSAEARQLAQTMQLRKAAEFRPEIDLRGYTVEEAILAVEKYLDDAQLAGASSVRLIHGKGTGALRLGLQRFLRQHPAVKTFHLAPFSEGGEGVTIVELR